MRSVTLAGILCACLLSNQSLAEQTLTIAEALRNKAIKIEVKGNSTSNQMSVVCITNSLPFPVSIRVEAGRRFIARDSATQDLLITKTEVIKINASAKIITPLFSLCCQKNDAAPDEKDNFSVGKMADANLVALAQLIDKNNLYASDAVQNAIWCLSDNLPVTRIQSSNKAVTDLLRKFVAEKKGIDLSKIVENTSTPENDGEERVSSRTVVYKFSSSYTFSLLVRSTVSLILYDPTNEIAVEVIKNESLGTGTHKRDFSMVSPRFKEGNYTLRLFSNGEVISERKFRLTSY